MIDWRDNDFSFYMWEILNWLLNVAIFGLLFLIAAKVFKNIPALLNIITV